MGCLFCCDPEPNYKPETGNDFICSLCVQILLAADQEDLKRAYGKAIERGYTRKANAIESFLIEGVINNERKTKKSKRDLARKRPMRAARPPRNKLRPQQAVVQLDTRRVEIC
jgi:hypothetical protein